MEKKPEKENSNYSGLVAVMMMAGILIFTGTVKLCIPSVLNREFIIAGSGMTILWGIAMAVRYFVKSEYKKAGNYDLALGILFTAAGAAVFLYASELEEFFSTAITIFILISGLIIFQQAIQDIQLHGYLFILQFLLGIAVTGLSVVLLFFPGKWVLFDSVLYWSLVTASGASLILSQIFIGVRLALWNAGKKREETKEKEADDDLMEEYPDKVPVYKDDSEKDQSEDVQSADAISEDFAEEQSYENDAELVSHDRENDSDTLDSDETEFIENSEDVDDDEIADDDENADDKQEKE